MGSAAWSGCGHKERRTAERGSEVAEERGPQQDHVLTERPDHAPHLLSHRMSSGWTGMANGPARGQNGPKGGKASTQLDVENYFNINEVQQLVNRAVNSVAEERPADFKKGLSAAITAHAMSGLAPEAAKKRHTKKDAEEAKKYLDKNNAEAILSEMLGKLAVTMPANASQSLAEYVMTATGADAYVAPKADKPPKEEKR